MTSVTARDIILVEVNMITLTITNTPGGQLTQKSALILEDGTHVPIPEELPSGSKAAPRRIGYTLGQHGYVLSNPLADSIRRNGDTTMVEVTHARFVSSLELAQALWPGCLDEADQKGIERCSASARRWASRAAQKDPGMSPQSRVETMGNGKKRAVLVWDLELAMRIRAASLGSGNWKQTDESMDGDA